MKIKIFTPVIFLLVFLVSCAVIDRKETTQEYLDDAEITLKIKMAIAKDPKLKLYEIKVETFKGEVQLSGFVDNYQQAARAEDKALSVSGVKSVENDLIVRHTKRYSKGSFKTNAKEYISDAAITAKIKTAISDVEYNYVTVETSKGEVRLGGSVDTIQQAAEVEDKARGVKGVKLVHNDIKVKHSH